MFYDDAGTENFRKLLDECKAYLTLQKRYVQLETTEKLTILLSTLLWVTLAVVLGLVALFYLSFALVYLLAPWVGGISAGFGLVAGVHLLLLVLLCAFRQRLIVRPITRFLARLLLTPADDPQEENV